MFGIAQRGVLSEQQVLLVVVTHAIDHAGPNPIGKSRLQSNNKGESSIGRPPLKFCLRCLRSIGKASHQPTSGALAHAPHVNLMQCFQERSQRRQPPPTRDNCKQGARWSGDGNGGRSCIG